MKRSEARSLSEEIDLLIAGKLPPEDAERVLEAVATNREAASELASRKRRALDRELKAEAADHIVKRRRRLRTLAAAVAAAVVACLAVVVAVALRPVSPPPRVLATNDLELRWNEALAPERQVKVRLSWPTADRHRLYNPPRAGEKRYEDLPPELLIELKRSGDPRALVAALLLSGSLPAANSALERVQEESADLWSDRAALALVEGDVERAILASAFALELQPGHAQALWNRALALDALGLDRSAAAAFEQLAERDEPGWSGEARDHAASLRATRAEREARWKHVQEAGAAMVEGGPPPLDLVSSSPGLMRLYFYDAVRTAPSAERVNDLRSLAGALDEISGGHVLVGYVDRIAALPFARRAPFAARYLAMVRRTLDPGQVAALIKELRAARQDDMLLGALTLESHRTPLPPAAVTPYVKLAKATRDPWFELLAAQRQAEAAIAANDVAAAESMLRATVERCSDRALEYRCLRTWVQLANLYKLMHRPSEAADALDHARRVGAVAGVQTDTLLFDYAHVASQRDDTGGARHAIVKAYLEELDRSDASDLARAARESAAMALVNENRLAEAKALLEAGQRPYDVPFMAHQAFVRAHLVAPNDRAATAELRAQIKARRAMAPPDELVMLDHIEGRLLIYQSPDEARALLRRAIAAGDGSTERVKARSYSYSVLIQDAARGQRWGEVFRLLAEERGVTSVERCVLGAAEEYSAVFAAVGPTGATVGGVIPRAVGSPIGKLAVPAEVRAVLEGCAVVDVLARQPYYGRADLLPREQVWQFRGGPGSNASGASHRALVIGNIEPPPSLGLPPLNRLQAVAGAGAILEGAEATPARALEAMRDVGFVEIHTHGLGSDDGSFLVLAPDAEGKYALTSSQIASARLDGRPVVMLAACGGGAIGTRFHTTWSLPDAFLRAGARAVVASPEPIADASAQRFFAGLRGRLSAGTAPAQALRDERLAWVDAPQRAWIDHLVVFQ